MVVRDKVVSTLLEDEDLVIVPLGILNDRLTPPSSGRETYAVSLTDLHPSLTKASHTF